MTTDPNTIDSTSAGQNHPHMSDAQAEDTVRDDNDQQLHQFMKALGMRGAIDTDKVATLLEHVIKEATSANIDWLEGQMREDGWEAALAPGENLTEIATRANAYLESPEGVELFNLFTRTFARTTGEIFD